MQQDSKLTFEFLIVAVVAGIVLPYLARRDVRLLASSDDEDEDAELARLQDTVRQWQAEAVRKGKPLRLPIMPFLLRNIWMGSMLLFSFITASTFFVTKVWQVRFRLLTVLRKQSLTLCRPLWLSA
jgi:solute carrier family 45 protein 1/2/4